jgi:hypothetical protein
MRKLKNLSLLKAGTWVTNGTEWLIAIQLFEEHGSGQNKYLFTS